MAGGGEGSSKKNHERGQTLKRKMELKSTLISLDKK